jgi:hypothetical protein
MDLVKGTKFCIFIGYGDGVKGCRLWDPTIQKSSLAEIYAWNNQYLFRITKGRFV